MSKKLEPRRTFLKASLVWYGTYLSSLVFSNPAFAFMAPRIRRKRKGVWCFWGSNANGQFGNGANGTSVSAPVALFSGDVWDRINVGLETTMAINNKNELWAFGRNNFGQLGVGNNVSRSSPTQVGSLTTWTDLSRSYGPYNFALQSSSLYGWGQNPEGNIGNGASGTNISTPVQIGGAWSMVAAGDYHSLGIKADGTLWGWGFNSSGQVGNGVVTDVTSPVQIQTGSTFVKVCASPGNSYAIRSDGTLWAWGGNSEGQLGNGVANANKVSTPIQVGSLTTWSDVEAGGSVVFAKKNDGTFWCWGYNNEGQLGLGAVGGRSSPVLFSASSWARVVPSWGFTIGLKDDGSLYSWGYGSGGVLGTGSTGNFSSPVQIPGRWQKIAVGYTHVVGLRF